MLYITCMMTGEELSENRARLGLTQAEMGKWIADQLGLTRAYATSEVSNWETGQRDVPAKVAAALWRHKARRLEAENRKLMAGQLPQTQFDAIEKIELLLSQVMDLPRGDDPLE